MSMQTNAKQNDIKAVLFRKPLLGGIFHKPSTRCLD